MVLLSYTRYFWKHSNKKRKWKRTSVMLLWTLHLFCLPQVLLVFFKKLSYSRDRCTVMNMLAKILKRHTSRDQLVGGNAASKLSPSKNSIVGLTSTTFSSSNGCNGSNTTAGLPVSSNNYLTCFGMYGMPINLCTITHISWLIYMIIQYSNNNYHYSTLTSDRSYWETIRNLNLISLLVIL